MKLYIHISKIIALAIFGLSRNLGNFSDNVYRMIIVTPAHSVGGTYLGIRAIPRASG